MEAAIFALFMQIYIFLYIFIYLYNSKQHSKSSISANSNQITFSPPSFICTVICLLAFLVSCYIQFCFLLQLLPRADQFTVVQSKICVGVFKASFFTGWLGFGIFHYCFFIRPLAVYECGMLLLVTVSQFFLLIPQAILVTCISWVKT